MSSGGASRVAFLPPRGHVPSQSRCGADFGLPRPSLILPGTSACIVSMCGTSPNNEPSIRTRTCRTRPPPATRDPRPGGEHAVPPAARPIEAPRIHATRNEAAIAPVSERRAGQCRRNRDRPAPNPRPHPGDRRPAPAPRHPGRGRALSPGHGRSRRSHAAADSVRTPCTRTR
jgi:hypothetical protein